MLLFIYKAVNLNCVLDLLLAKNKEVFIKHLEVLNYLKSIFILISKIFSMSIYQ